LIGAEVMSNKDLKIKMEIDEILNNKHAGVKLKTYFENMSDGKIRRAIHVLATIYPDKKNISDDDFSFILYMFSNENFSKQQSFPDFVRSLSLIDFTENQKNLLIDAIKIHFDELCEVCTFELNGLLINVFGEVKLLKYLESLSESDNVVVLQCVSSILRYEDFSNTNMSDDLLENLKNRTTSAARFK
jgi:hypothetical protein